MNSGLFDASAARGIIFSMKGLLLVALGLFLLMLVFRLIRGIIQGRRISAGRTCSTDELDDPELAKLIAEAREGGRLRDVIHKIEGRAIAASDAGARATYYCVAGDVSLIQMKRPSVAVGFYLRALREDPTYLPAMEKLQETLLAQKRLRRFERACWEVLGRLDEAEVGLEMWIKCWSGLATIYSASPRHVTRADAIRALVSAVTGASDQLPEPGDSSDSNNGNKDGGERPLPRVVS